MEMPTLLCFGRPSSLPFALSAAFLRRRPPPPPPPPPAILPRSHRSSPLLLPRRRPPLGLPCATFSSASASPPNPTMPFHISPSHRSRTAAAAAAAVQRKEAERAAATAAGALEVGSGAIHVIVGPMFSGKTTALLNKVHAEAEAGRRVALIKSDKDTRYGLTAVVSHDGIQMPCWAVPTLAAFRQRIGEESYSELDVIGIDEAQFFEDLYTFCQVAADDDGKSIIVSGLDGDFLRKSFGSILELVPIADSIIKLSSRCEICGRPASFTFRKTDNTKREVIGGANMYMPVCRQHYAAGTIVKKIARSVVKDTDGLLSVAKCSTIC